MRVLQQVAGVAEQGQRIHRQVTVTAAETLPALGLVNGDDLGAQRAHGSEEESKLSKKNKTKTPVRLLGCAHLPAARRRVTEKVVDHVQLIFLHHDEALLPSLLPVHVRRPLDEK